MDYHSDRFQDHSLLIYQKGKLVGLMPMHRDGDEVYSHNGLSYGGLLLHRKIKFKEILSMFSSILKFLNQNGFQKLHLKLIPKIYQLYPSDEIDYLLFLSKAQMYRAGLLCTIDMRNPIKIQSNRIEGVKKAQKAGLIIKEEAFFKDFWEQILIPNLSQRHDAKPVHSLEEIELLAKRFPDHIRQFNVYDGETLVAGATIFENHHLAHVQYISANTQRQQLGSLDYLFHNLITDRYKDKQYFDFGVSDENKGLQINEGLLYWKETFGGRGVIQQSYTIDTKNHSLLDAVFV